MLYFLNPHDKKIFISRTISFFFPFKEEEISKVQDDIEFKEFLDWECISENTQIEWCQGIIEKFEDKLNFKKLSSLENVVWSESLIDKYEGRWDWGSLTMNPSLPWTIDFIKKYFNKWKWKGKEGNWMEILCETIASNTGIRWTGELIKEFKDNLEWDALSDNSSLELNLKLLDEYKDNWNWKYLSGNSAIPWSDTFKNRFASLLDWDYLSFNKALPWGEKFIEDHTDFISFKMFSWNQRFNWDSQFIEKNKDILDWEKLSGNPSLPWSYDLIKRFKTQWDVTNLLSNKSIKWDDTLIDLLEESIWWERFFESNFSTDRLEILIDKHLKEINWWNFSLNETINFNLRLLSKYAPLWIWYDENYGGYSNGKGLSGNRGLFDFLINSSDYKDIIGLCTGLNKYTNTDSSSFVNIHEDVFESLESTVNHDGKIMDEKAKNLFDYTNYPGYIQDTDIDQQGPDFDF